LQKDRFLINNLLTEDAEYFAPRDWDELIILHAIAPIPQVNLNEIEYEIFTR